MLDRNIATPEQRNQILAGLTKKGRSKYNSVRTQNADGTWSDSRREAKWDSQIMAMKRDPDVKRVTRKARYPLIVNSVLISTYECDWTVEYHSKAIRVFDAKGHRTKAYTQKRKLMKSIYGIEIEEL